MGIVSRKVRNSAQGEDCTVNIAGRCNYSPETVVLAHLPDESSGMGKKADDVSSCYACSACHDCIDRRAWDQDFEDNREWYLRRAQTRTLRQLIHKGIVRVA